MPVARSEHRGADELYKYYEVYETIGSGNDNVNVFRNSVSVRVMPFLMCAVNLFRRLR